MRHAMVFALVALGLSACAAAAQPEKMTVERGTDLPAVSQAQRGAIWVKSVDGGKKTSPMWKSEISSDDFRTALEASLRNYGYLAPDSASARYTLAATLVSVDQPAFGLALTVTTTVSYRIRNTRTYETVTREITARGIAGAGEAFLGSERLKIANERSAAENIRMLLGEIQSLP